MSETICTSGEPTNLHEEDQSRVTLVRQEEGGVGEGRKQLDQSRG